MATPKGSPKAKAVTPPIDYAEIELKQQCLDLVQRISGDVETLISNAKKVFDWVVKKESPNE